MKALKNGLLAGAMLMVLTIYSCHASRHITAAGGDVKRIKLSIVEGYTEEGDKFTANDQFVTVVYRGNLILCTGIKDDNNKATWPDEYVIFDYSKGDTVVISQLDDDFAYHDLLSQYVGPLKAGIGTAHHKTSHLTFLVEEVKAEVKTTGVAMSGNGDSTLFFKDIKAKAVLKDKSSLKFDKK